MSRKITFFMGSGANIHSMYKNTCTLEDLTEEEWDSMTDEEKDEIAREIAWERVDWGWYEE